MISYTILYYLILSYTILYYLILSCTILYYLILSYTILYYLILSYTILYYLILSYTILYYAGHSRGADNVKSFSQLTEGSSVPGLCTWTTPPTCVATPVGDLQWRLHGRHSYYVTLKLEGVNGLERVVSSDEYEHYIGPPSGGVVVEIPVNTTELVVTYVIVVRYTVFLTNVVVYCLNR